MLFPSRTGKPTPLTEALKEELYVSPYERVNWDKARNLCAKEDLYYPHPLLQDAIWWTFQTVEPYVQQSSLRKRALNHCMEHIHYEDENTRYVCIGPVNKVCQSCIFLFSLVLENQFKSC